MDVNRTSSTESEHHTASVASPAGLITSWQLYFGKALLCPVTIPVSFVGFVGNLLNVMVFYKMGLSDTSTLIFFALSLSDLGVTFFMFWREVFDVMVVLENLTQILFDIDPLIMQLISSNIFSSFVMSSMLFSTLLAVQRSFCVALPFHVRDIFTRTRTLVFLILVAIVSLTLAGATIAIRDAQPVFVGRNRTRLQLVNRWFRDIVIFVAATLKTWCVAFCCEVIVIISLAVMVVGLRRSSQFKRRAKTVPSSQHLEKATVSSSEKTQNKKSEESEKQLIKVVTLVSVVFITSNTPIVVLHTVRLFITDLDTFGRYSNLHRLLYKFATFLELVSASVNIVPYWSLSSRYKEVFNLLFTKQSVRD